MIDHAPLPDPDSLLLPSSTDTTADVGRSINLPMALAAVLGVAAVLVWTVAVAAVIYAESHNAANAAAAGLAVAAAATLTVSAVVCVGVSMVRQYVRTLLIRSLVLCNRLSTRRSAELDVDQQFRSYITGLIDRDDAGPRG